MLRRAFPQRAEKATARLRRFQRGSTVILSETETSEEVQRGFILVRAPIVERSRCKQPTAHSPARKERSRH